jgi:mono/diheme cytochrome c family protein
MRLEQPHRNGVCSTVLVPVGAGSCPGSIEARRRKLTTISHRLAPAATLIASMVLAAPANAADAENGERIAQSRCAACHIVAVPIQQREVADAPPFETIARKFDFNADMLVFHLLEPHPKMNFALTRPKANDVAAYMSTLAR